MEPTKIFFFEIYFGLCTHHPSFNSENKKENKTTISNIVIMTFCTYIPFDKGQTCAFWEEITKLGMKVL